MDSLRKSLVLKFGATLYGRKDGPRNWLGFINGDGVSLRVQLLLFKCGSLNIGVSLRGDGDYPLTFIFCIPLLIRFYLDISTQWLRLIIERVTRHTDRDIGIRFFEWTLWVSLWENTKEWSRDDPEWWHFYIDIRKLLIGDHKNQEQVHRCYDVTVALPEGDYLVHAKDVTLTRSWPRWPFKKRFHRVLYEVADGGDIPFPGKGENSWDMGDDGLSGGSLLYTDGLDLADHIRDMILDYRRKRGGPLDWSENKGVDSGILTS